MLTFRRQRWVFSSGEYSIFIRLLPHDRPTHRGVDRCGRLHHPPPKKKSSDTQVKENEKRLLLSSITLSNSLMLGNSLRSIVPDLMSICFSTHVDSMMKNNKKKRCDANRKHSLPFQWLHGKLVQLFGFEFIRVRPGWASNIINRTSPKKPSSDNQPELEWIVSNTWRKSVTFTGLPSPRVRVFSKKVVVSVLSFFIVNWIKLWSKKEEMNLCLFSTQQLISASPMAGRSFRINAFWVDVRRLLTLGHLRRERLKRLDGRPSLWN
jgi:hypothetical protein